MSAPPPAAADPFAALGPEEFAHRLAAMGPFEACPFVAVAVSGGADSMALAFLARTWAEARHGRLLALVVDHSLRAGSADAAALACARLREHAVPTRLLAWTGPKPVAGIQAAAREARYALLEDACREAGILHLLLAHHAGDQAETVALRAARGSGAAGLAGMAAIVERPGLRLLRPLLGVHPARLRASLRAAGQPWIDDPGNRDHRFARTALRLDPTFEPDVWWQEGCRRAAARALEDEALAAFFAQAARPHPLGQMTLDRPALAALPPASRMAALARTLQAVRGGRYPVPKASLERLAARVLGTETLRMTLGGCALHAWATSVVIAREPGRITQRCTLVPGEAVSWDRRFRVAYQLGPGPLELAALGREGWGELPADARARLRASGAACATVASLPALRDGRRLFSCPSLTPWVASFGSHIGATAALEVRSPLGGPPFAGANVVSNPHRLIYPLRAGAEPVPGTLGAAPD